MTTNKTSPSDVSSYNPPLPPPPPVPHLPPPHKKIRSGHLNLISLHQATHSRTFDADNYIQYFYRSFQDYDEGMILLLLLLFNDWYKFLYYIVMISRFSRFFFWRELEHDPLRKQLIVYIGLGHKFDYYSSS